MEKQANPSDRAVRWFNTFFNPFADASEAYGTMRIPALFAGYGAVGYLISKMQRRGLESVRSDEVKAVEKLDAYEHAGDPVKLRRAAEDAGDPEKRASGKYNTDLMLRAAAAVAGLAAGYKVSMMTEQARRKDELDQDIGHLDAETEGLAKALYERTRGEEKTAFMDRLAEWWWVYAALAGTASFMAAKRYTDGTDPNRKRLKQVQQYASMKALERMDKQPPMISKRDLDAMFGTDVPTPAPARTTPAAPTKGTPVKVESERAAPVRLPAATPSAVAPPSREEKVPADPTDPFASLLEA